MAGDRQADGGKRGPFLTAQEAQAAKPVNDHFKLFQVCDLAGRAVYAWARDYDRAIAVVARSDGYKAISAGNAPTADKVEDMLAQLPAEQRAALLARYGVATEAARASEKPASRKGK
jgi:hypothetical protein